jgi:hypothetical protein
MKTIMSNWITLSIALSLALVGVAFCPRARSLPCRRSR